MLADAAEPGSATSCEWQFLDNTSKLLLTKVKDGDLTQDQEVKHNAIVVTKGNNSTNS